MSAAQMDLLKAEVTAIRGVAQSAEALIKSLHDRLVAADSGDNPALTEVITDLATERAALAQAIADNP